MARSRLGGRYEVTTIHTAPKTFSIHHVVRSVTRILTTDGIPDRATASVIAQSLNMGTVDEAGAIAALVAAGEVASATPTPEPAPINEPRIDRLALHLQNDLTNAYEALARAAARMRRYADDLTKYGSTFGQAGGISTYSDDPAAGFVAAREDLSRTERTFDQSLWLLGYDPEAIELLKSACRERVHEGYRSYYF